MRKIERILINEQLDKVHNRLTELFDMLEDCKVLSTREAIEENILRLSVKHTELSEELNNATSH